MLLRVKCRRDSSVSIVTEYGLHNRGTLVRFPREKCNYAKRLDRLRAHLAYFVGAGDFYCKKKETAAWSYHSSPYSTHVMNGWNYTPFPHTLMARKGTTFLSFATRVSQLKIWHFWDTGIERKVYRCTFNRYSFITQFAKFAAGEQLGRRCTYKKL